MHIVADNIIISAKNNQEYDNILIQVLERAKDHNIVFNLHKLQGRKKVSMTGQAKLNSEHYLIKYVGGRQYCYSILFLSVVV